MSAECLLNKNTTLEKHLKTKLLIDHEYHIQPSKHFLLPNLAVLFQTGCSKIIASSN